MKHNSRSKKALAETAAHVIQNSSVDISTQCQILHQLTESGELNLLDLPRLQTELERLLAANTQRMICISKHLNGEEMPTPVLRSVGLLEPDPNNQPQHPLETARLKQAKSEESSSSSCLRASTNPDNPLSIIISNKKDQPLEVKTEGRDGVQNEKAKEAAKAVPSSPLPSPCEIPNRFWALMEPYCADITESNISYLEGILKSYVEEATTSKYFQLPQSKYAKDNDHISPKRLRRDTSTKSEVTGNAENSEASTNSSQFTEALKSATEMVSLARRVDTQLGESKSASSSMEKLLESLEKSLYENNVSSVLRRAVANMAQEMVGKAGNRDDSSHPTTIEGVTENGGSSTAATSDDLSCVCSQPLKYLARQLQVSSSFRVEKKIGQAIEELGLFPIGLYLNHRSHRPDKPLLPFPERINSVLPFPFNIGAPNHDASESSTAESKSSLSNGLDQPLRSKEPPPSSPKSPTRCGRRARSETASESRQKPPISGVRSNCSPLQSDLKNGGGGEGELECADTIVNAPASIDPSVINEEEDTYPADAEIDGSNADTTDEIPSIPPQTLPGDEETADGMNDPNDETLRPIENHKSPSSAVESDKAADTDTTEKKAGSFTASCKGELTGVAIGEGSEWFVGSVPQLNGTDDDEDFSNCILNLTSSSTKNPVGSGSVIEAASGSTDQITLAVMRRQRELRQVCASNHNILHRLVQAARRDLQRQEIQRRLAIADADVLEAHNKLETSKSQKRPALKRDRDFAWKTLKERQKIRAELDAFDKKPP